MTSFLEVNRAGFALKRSVVPTAFVLRRRPGWNYRLKRYGYGRVLRRRRYGYHVFASSVTQRRMQYSESSGVNFVELASPEAAAKSEERCDRIPLSFHDGNVVTHLGLTLVEGVDAAAFLNQSESLEGDVVLGFNSKNGMTHMEDFTLGKLDCERFVSSARCKLWWMTPEWGSSARDLTPETQFLLTEVREGGPYAILLPLIDRSVYRATIRPPKYLPFGDQEMILRVESGDESVKANKFNSILYVAAGWDPYSLVDRAVISAAKLSGGARPRTEKTLPESLDAFGWCTWDAFYSTVSAKGIKEGLQTLKDGGFPPKLLIIDDGWQTTALDQAEQMAPTEPLKLPKQYETEAECTLAETEVLAEASAHLPHQTANVVMPTLSAMGPQPSGVEEDEDEYDEKEEEVKAAVSTIQRMVGSLVGFMSSACLLAYEWLVDKAPPGSTRVRMFTYLANGPLRKPLLNFYAMAGDFSRRLVSVKANGKFSSPNAAEDKKWNRKENLAEVIRFLKTEMGVAYVYLWHGMSAYWSGISQEEPAMAKYHPRVLKAKPTPGILEVEPSLAWNPSVVGGVGVVDCPEQLYLDMHDYLKSAGATGVKVDAQAGVGMIGSVLGGGAALAYKWHMALEESVEKHFPGNHVINCMCHSTENLYRMLNTAIARASDDFYPRDPASTTPHIANCAYNSLFLAPLVQPDWDMFQTKHGAADLHAAARTVSGGAIYISDKPDQHNFEILSQLVLPDGSILRPQLPGRPTRDCLFRNTLKDGRTLLKVWTRNALSGIVGVFNLQGASWDRQLRQFRTHNAKPPSLQARVSPHDVECLASMAEEHRLFNGKYVAYAFRKKQFFVGGEDICLCVELPAYGSEIVSFTPVLRVARVDFAAIGFPHLLNGSGAVRSCAGRRVKVSQLQIEWSHRGEDNDHSKQNPASQLQLLEMTTTDRCTLFDISIKGCGTFLMYSSKKPVDVWVNASSVPFQYERGSGELTVDIEQTASLDNDVQVLFK